MTKRELGKLKKIKQEITQIKKELADVEFKYITDSVKGSSPDFPYTEHTITISGIDINDYNKKVLRIQNRLNRKLSELMDERDSISEYIYTIDDGDLRQILTYKYINGLTWVQIGFSMGYSSETVRKKHDKFISRLHNTCI
ncbi:MAG: RNA polymerase subunit sigma-24 [Clostridia bacterium]|jgi:hypothetical protein